MVQTFNFTDLEAHMKKSIDNLESEFTSLRTGRATTALLDHVIVTAYGQNTPLTQVASVSASDARMLTVQVWDKSLVGAVEKAIQNSDLGLNPAVHGDVIRLSIPPLTQERRKELSKVAGKQAEAARVALRSIRHNAMADLKKMEKDSGLSKDDIKSISDKIQKVTDKFVAKVEELLKQKEKEILA